MDHRYPTKSVARMDLQFAPERSSFRGSDGAMFDKLLAERDRLLADNKVLRDALEPFANAVCDDLGVTDDMPIEDCTELTEGHLKRAKAALATTK